MSDTAKTYRPDESIVSTQDLALATCMATLGVPFKKDAPIFALRGADGKVRASFNFEKASPDGRHDAADLMRKWGDPAFAAANPDHPLLYAKAALLNRHRLVDAIKDAAPFVAIKRGKLTYLVREGSEAHRNLVA